VSWIVQECRGEEKAEPEEEAPRVRKLRTLAPPEEGRGGESQRLGEVSGVPADHDRFHRGIHERASSSRQRDSRILGEEAPKRLGSCAEKAPRESHLTFVLVHLDDLCDSPLSHGPDIPIGGWGGVHRRNHGGRGEGLEEVVEVRRGTLAAACSEVGVYDHDGCRWCLRDALKQILPTLKRGELESGVRSPDQAFVQKPILVQNEERSGRCLHKLTECVMILTDSGCVRFRECPQIAIQVLRQMVPVAT